MITLIDYGVGNTKAFLNVYRQLNIPVSMAKTAAEIESASKLILPGVGSFDHAMDRLNHSGMREALDKAVLIKKIPVLGICVGMQMMLQEGREHGHHTGLGWIEGAVMPIMPPNAHYKIPHMGWNDLYLHNPHPALQGIREGDHAYFVHSYHAQCSNPRDVLATVEYGEPIAALIGRDNLLGAQFHPEKSQKTGLTLIENFLKL